MSDEKKAPDILVPKEEEVIDTTAPLVTVFLDGLIKRPFEYGPWIRAWVDQLADETGEGLLVMDGYDDCIVGVSQRFNRRFVTYDRRKVIRKLMADGMTREEAIEFHEFNQVGAWTGEHTVAFLDMPGAEDDDDEA